MRLVYVRYVRCLTSQIEEYTSKVGCRQLSSQDTVIWILLQVLAKVVIKACNHGRDQTNLCFPYNPPFTNLECPTADHLNEDSSRIRGGDGSAIFISKLLGPLNNCNMFSSVTNFTTLSQCCNSHLHLCFRSIVPEVR